MARPNSVELMRRLMPAQFTRLTKLCATCGNRVQWDTPKKRLVCRRCKREY